MDLFTLRRALASENSNWKDKRYEFSDGNVIFKGLHEDHKASMADDNWQIWKLTYDDGNITRIEGPLIGSWSNRASLAWA